MAPPFQLIAISLFLSTSLIAQTKSLPQGIYYYEGLSSSGSHNDPNTWTCWVSPTKDHIHGVLGRETWGEYEPSEGVYNDAIFFGIIASRAASTRLQYEIQITINGAGNYPQWVVTAGAKTTNVHSNSGAVVTVINPGDPVFQAKLKAMLTHLGSIYDRDINCRVIQMTGPGRSGECVFCSQNPTYISDWTWLQNQGGGTVDGGEDLWELWATTIAGYYAAAFPTTHFEYATGGPVPNTIDPNNDTMHNVVIQLVGSYNRAGVRFGTSSHGFSLNAPTADYGTGMQGYQQTDAAGAPGAGNEAVKLLGNDNSGRPYNANWFEVAHKDCDLPGNWPGMDQFNQQAP
jgi:hypothetical protein